MKKTFHLLGLNGSLIWCAAILVRSMNLTLPAPLRFIIGVAPNFGVVWLLLGIFVAFFPIAFKRESTRAERFVAIAGIIALLVLSELVHFVFLGAGFDIADLVVSLVAAIPLLVLNIFSDQAV